MAALADYAKDKSSSFGLQLSLSSIGFDIGKLKGYDETLTNASITAAGNVFLTSGRDTALLGGNIIGRTVDLDVGRDLTILSPQAQGWRDGFSFGLTLASTPPTGAFAARRRTASSHGPPVRGLSLRRASISRLPKTPRWSARCFRRPIAISASIPAR
ncbi:hemagglutinin repeat-containing protein [Agrobacterium tumefaciens]|uniref:hemagglutinin repeat-containing protein n=1 Tax=Agrobacterium tumefaciens TaxID=358 RepID=UPI000DD49BB4|nr:hemagglutinin repeat-containing protein [Agrobacterium tumefaciens]